MKCFGIRVTKECKAFGKTRCARSRFIGALKYKGVKMRLRISRRSTAIKTRNEVSLSDDSTRHREVLWVIRVVTALP